MSQQCEAGDNLAPSRVLTQQHYDAAAVLLANSHWFELAGAMLLGTTAPDLEPELSACQLRGVESVQEAARRLSLENLDIAPGEIKAILDALSGASTAACVPQVAR